MPDGRARGRMYLIQLRCWRPVAHRVVSVPQVHNVLGWFHCRVPCIRGRLRKLFEPWRWKQG